MGKLLGLPEVLETYDEDENHLGLARPKKVLWQTTAPFKSRPSISGSHPYHLSPKPQVGPETSPFSRNRILPRFEKYYRKMTNLSSNEKGNLLG